MNLKLKVLLDRKGNIIHSVSPDATIKKAVGILNRFHIGALIILNFDGMIEGIITERDVMQKLAKTDGLVGHLPVKSIMTPKEKLVIGKEDQTIEELMNLMTMKKIRHIPLVSKDDILLGIISIRDIIKILLEDSTQKVKQLSNYIMGNYPM